MSKNEIMPDASATYIAITELQPKHRFYARLQELRAFYCSQFGAEPGFFVRMPGRVNIIGEHVDYCGYPVLPMAIDQCILLAVGDSAEDTLLQLRNMENDKFQNFKCDLKEFVIDLPKTGGPEWYKYYLCGVKGVYETLAEDSVRPIGMRIALSGNIPPASGLSSSSALVSAAVLATSKVHRLPLERKHLASIAANCERYIGTQGGGMDQAIAYLAQAGCAQFIEFHPELSATSIQLPTGACFVVANSLAAINKAASSDFNERVVECRLGARLIAKRKQVNNWREITRFAQLQQALHCDLAELEAFALECLPKECYTRQDLCKELGVQEGEFERDFLTPNTLHMNQFKLRQRGLHVIQESLRVQEFRAICEQTCNRNRCGSDMNGTNAGEDVNNGAGSKTLADLSKLMRESHYSLKNLYECSHPDLDRLVAISDAADVGARLTGAGWGGCIVALCHSVAATEEYMQELKDKYFSQLPTHILDTHRHNDFADVVFATFPQHGAEIFTCGATITTT